MQKQLVDLPGCLHRLPDTDAMHQHIYAVSPNKS